MNHTRNLPRPWAQSLLHEDRQMAGGSLFFFLTFLRPFYQGKQKDGQLSQSSPPNTFGSVCICIEPKKKNKKKIKKQLIIKIFYYILTYTLTSIHMRWYIHTIDKIIEY